jgi:cephalosporin hydroxylase
MINPTARKIGRALMPIPRQLIRKLRLRAMAHDLMRCLQRASSIEERVDLVRAHRQFRSNQKRTELIALCRELVRLRPKLLCEIGAARGGTLAIFASVAAPDARILSLDMQYPSSWPTLYQSLKRPAQRIVCLESDSHSGETLSRVKQWLSGARFDFLFIDADHSYAGVKADYEMYGPLVRPGGIIAFHDIVPDFRTRFGVVTVADVGEVPKYWAELTQVVEDYRTVIEDPMQDGYGIGLIYVPSG